MKVINDVNILMSISGGTEPDNAAIASSLGKDMAYAAGGAVLTGPVGMAVAAGGAAVQNVVRGAIENGPVNVAIPTVPMGPNWNGSGRPPSFLLLCRSQQGRSTFGCEGFTGG